MTGHRYIVRFRVSERGGDLGSVLDMMRYDRAIVRDWSPAGVGEAGQPPRWSVTFETERPATLDRWGSFGLYPKEAR